MHRVLLVEDDEAFRIFCRVALEAAGYEVLQARDGTAAVEKALRDRPDCVVLDLWLPGLTGSGVLRVIRANRRLDRVPVIVLSGVPEVKDREGLISFGADEVLEKPVTTETLVERVRGWISHGRRPTPSREPRGRLEPA
ncbi:MAG TPA: response regulator transcription factor [Candidatus Eisenbacteria bacterium]|nr:response regulator transcription factor [Candidatus Eisenbacteria bacterium]